MPLNVSKYNASIHITFLLLIVLWSVLSQTITAQTDADIDSSSDELIATINAYRVAHGLPAVNPSRTLNLVAKLHVEDLQANNPDKGVCNMHSWSKAGDWSACCYKDVNPKAVCMWDKPREISGFKYTSNGYEVSAWLSEKMNAGAALELWKKSHGHHEVIMNRGSWSSVRWRSIGAAMSENYAVVWFGTIRDAAD